ncbi:hypothetical protein EV426DRAFT_708511 [Tirmania nivea]|nr:hypothetical protein EV426DRAFT_708511 [Tirmania nivea]
MSSPTLIKLAGPIATLSTGALICAQNIFTRRGIDKKFDSKFDAMDNKLDIMRKDFNDDIKGSNTKFEKHKKEVEGEQTKILEKVAFVDGEVQMVKEGICSLLGSKDSRQEIMI